MITVCFLLYSPSVWSHLFQSPEQGDSVMQSKVIPALQSAGIKGNLLLSTLHPADAELHKHGYNKPSRHCMKELQKEDGLR